VLADGVRAAGAALILAVAGWRWPDAREARRVAARRREIAASLPDALDLMSACTRAGASVAQAFALAADRDRGALGSAMRGAVDALEHGLSRERAYEILRRGADVPEVSTMTSTLRRAEQLGTSVSVTLTELATEMREQRRATAEEQARGTPVRILFPIVVCFLPAFGLLTVAPVLIVALRSFRGV
jgi:tight adherence protein C